MPTPVSPIIPGIDLPETVFGKNQPEYNPLPSFQYNDGTILTRWHLSWKERILCLLVGDIYLFQMTFLHPMQPITLQIERPKIEIRNESKTLDYEAT